jgi:hypothetical protein
MHPELLSVNDAKKKGFATYNGCQHLCLEIPDGMTTISARTSEGKKITFSFLPYKTDGPPQCVDIEHQTTTTFRTEASLNGHPWKLNNQSVILFGYQKKDIKIRPNDNYSKTCVLLHELAAEGTEITETLVEGSQNR